MSLLGSVLTLGGMILGGALGSIIPGIGTSVGIAVGAAIGGAVGGYIGTVLFPDEFNHKKEPPPQPYENRVQVSTYGNSIPIVYESSRLAGNVIYMQPVQTTIVSSRHRQDGVRYFEYVRTYTSTFAIAFCEGPVAGISRIWVNGKIFADYRDPAGDYYPAGSVGLASANLETTIARAAVYFTIYTGSETQTADPTIAAILGAAETPAYRGICYIVFKDFPIGETNGVPQIEVEIGPQMAATGDCDELFEGDNGSAYDEALYTADYHVGGAVEIQNNKLQFTGSSATKYTAIFSFAGEFDINLDFYHDVIGETDAFYVALLLNGWDFNVSYWYNKASFDEGNGYTAGDEEFRVDGDINGRIRLRRDSSNNIYAYYWNASLSRYEWNGNTGGLLIGNDASTITPGFYVQQTIAGEIMSIGEIIVTLGCPL